MTSIRRNARIAGFIYLALLIAPFRLIYIPSKLFVAGDPTATAANIAANEMLFRLGMVSELACGVILIFLVLAFMRLFEGVNKTLSLLVLIAGGIIPATIDFTNVLNDAAALILIRGPEYLSAFDKPQRDALAMLFLRLHGQQILAAEILWGLWLFPLAGLILQSRYFPRFLGWWLIANGVAYIAQSLAGLLWPGSASMVEGIAFPALLGEVAFMLWLVIMGAKEPAALPSPRSSS